MLQKYTDGNYIYEAVQFNSRNKDRVYIAAIRKQSDVYHAWDEFGVPMLVIPLKNGKEEKMSLNDYLLFGEKLKSISREEFEKKYKRVI